MRSQEEILADLVDNLWLAMLDNLNGTLSDVYDDRLPADKSQQLAKLLAKWAKRFNDMAGAP